MGEVTVATPLLVEYKAVKRALRDARLARTGMGPRKSRASRASIAGDGPLLVMGVAGGLSPDVKPGDVIVASEVREGLTVVAVTKTDELVDALTRAGFRVCVGPIVSVTRVAGEQERVALAATGAIAVDTESAQLVDGWPGRPIAVVRIVVDAASAPLYRPGTAARGLRALKVLRRAVPIVEAWATNVAGAGRTPDGAGPAMEGH
jgi:4-hydroxy-3-methylbut-2-enyl diphosphate reductase